MARNYTEAELADLTDAEREGLMDDSDEMPAPSNFRGDAHGDDDEEMELDDADAAGEGEGEGDDDAKIDEAADDAAGKEDAAAVDALADLAADIDAAKPADGGEQPTVAVEHKSSPLLHAEAPADVDARIADIKTKKDTLCDRFDGGDLTSREFQAQMDSLNKEEREIENSVFKAQIAAEMSESQARNTWESTVNQFFDDFPEYRGSALRHGALDTVVKQVAADASSENLTGRQILEKAHEKVRAELGTLSSAKDESKGKADEKKADEKPTGKATRADIPPTLGKLPAAEISDTDGNRFAALDRLADTDPLKYEAQLERMMKSDRAAYDSYMAQ